MKKQMTSENPSILNPSFGNPGVVIRCACLALVCVLSAALFAGCGDASASAPKHPVAEASLDVQNNEDAPLAGEPLEVYECALAPNTEVTSSSAQQAPSKARRFAPIMLTRCTETH